METSEPIFSFCPAKNLQLKQDRGISFEEIIVSISHGDVLDILEHFNPGKYGNQKIYVVYAKEYVYLVPFVKEKNGDIFLKTIIPSRKAKKRYFHEKEIP